MKIYKQLLRDTHKQTITLPVNYSLLSVGVQGNDDMAVWYTHNDNEQEVNVEFSLVQTGGEVPVNTEYVGTFLLYSGTYILHLFKHL